MKNCKCISFLIATLMLLSSCTEDSGRPAEPDHSVTGEAERPNILLIIADDMGVETLECYERAVDPAVTPTLDDLCLTGVRFDNVWSAPTCSPTRATILTGNYGFRNGVMGPVIPNTGNLALSPKVPEGANKEIRYLFPEKLPQALKDRTVGLSTDGILLPKVLSGLGYATGAFGKWHLETKDNGADDHANLTGFDHFRGLGIGGVARSYFASLVVENGVRSTDERYVATMITDDTLSWIEQQNRPWFAWVAHISPHTPLHKPPEELLSSQAERLVAEDISKENARPYYLAMIEAMDTEIGRLLKGLTPEEKENTVVIFIGDNGVPHEIRETTPYPPSRVKGTVYQGGVHVPMIITGTGVSGQRAVEGLVNTTDLFATIIELAGGDASPESGRDSISFVESLGSSTGETARQYAYAEIRAPLPGPDGKPVFRDDRSVRDASYKLLQVDGEEELYGLRGDPLETANLLAGPLNAEQQAAADRLRQWLRNLRGEE